MLLKIFKIAAQIFAVLQLCSFYGREVTRNVPSNSLLSVRGMKGRVSSGGYSNLGTRGKDCQKLMFSKKEKEFCFGKEVVFFNQTTIENSSHNGFSIYGL